MSNKNKALPSKERTMRELHSLARAQLGPKAAAALKTRAELERALVDQAAPLAPPAPEPVPTVVRDFFTVLPRKA